MRLVLGLLVCFSSIALQASDWPRFRGPDADGISKEKGINKDWKAKPPAELWRITLGDKGYAGPSVAAGKMFIIDHEGENDVIRAVDVKTGKDVWTFKYVDTAKDNYGFARATPTYDAGKIYTLSRMGLLHCLDAEKGSKLWSHDLKADFGGKTGAWDYAASPLVDGNKLIVCVGGNNASVVALDKTTGKEIWRGGGSDQAGYSTPVLATIENKKQYLVFTGLAITGVDAESGALLWRFPWKTQYDVNASAPVQIGGNFVFISANYGHGCALVAIGGGGAKAVWENKEVQQHFNSAILVGEHLYTTSDPGALVCLNPRDGKPVWRQPGFEKGGLIGIDGTMIVVDGKAGDVVMVNITTKAYEELGRIKPLGGQSWTAPIVADGKLYVRNKQYLVCLDLK